MHIIQGKPLPPPTEPEALAASIGQTVVLHGFVHKIRRMRGFAFVLLRAARAVVQCVYLEECARFPLDALIEGACVRAEGLVVGDERSRAGYEVRLISITELSRPAEPMPLVLNSRELMATLDTRLQLRPISLRHERERAVFKIQEGVARGFREYLSAQRFTEVHTPKIVLAGAEGGAGQFCLDYFGRPARLAQSPQLYKQMLVGAFERVFEIAPVYRAEKHDTARHINEFTGLDFEMGFIDSYEDIMRMQTAMLRHMMALLAEHYAPELELLGAPLPALTDIPALRFDEAKGILERERGRASADDMDLEPEEEQLLGAYAKRELGSEFLYVTHYPSAKRPFYAMDDPASPGVTLSFDLLFRGLEVTTGGQRIHDCAQQLAKMEARGMDASQFEHYLMIHRYGMPPHGGLGMGLERMTMQLLGQSNIRYACLFPRDTQRLEP